jgi:hypothetical protein
MVGALVMEEPDSSINRDGHERGQRSVVSRHFQINFRDECATWRRDGRRRERTTQTRDHCASHPRVADENIPGLIARWSAWILCDIKSNPVVAQGLEEEEPNV